VGDDLETSLTGHEVERDETITREAVADEREQIGLDGGGDGDRTPVKEAEGSAGVLLQRSDTDPGTIIRGCQCGWLSPQARSSYDGVPKMIDGGHDIPV